MNRRQFLSIAGVSLVATAPVFSSEKPAYENYTPELYESLLASGEPFLLSFHAKW